MGMGLGGGIAAATAASTRRRPLHVVGIGGTLRPLSSTEKALQFALDAVSAAGATTTLLAGHDLDLPIYAPERGAMTPPAERLVEELRRADAVIIASPSYHGSVSGLVKNVLDYAEELRGDARPYLDGRAVGCIVTAAGWQGTVTALMAMRSIVHALRGWPTPFGVTINTIEASFGQNGDCILPAVETQLQLMAAQLMDFASRWDFLPGELEAPSG